ncbi:MAG TPA: thymidine phosphorylase [Alphaproteobacteria bacterium]|nr:thymidine phosphorylase [Alphaproteobacteria bacterium]
MGSEGGATFLPQEIIRRKRSGESLTTEEISNFIKGLSDNSITEGQIAAWAMAVYFQGLDRAETVALTAAMTASGTVLDWSGDSLPGPLLDKHSTGGVGDKVSLLLGPMVSAAGGCVPMMSGRGLGHTGGTLDKLDSIPGYDTAPSIDKFRRAVAESGCAIIGQTADLAPADRRLYGIRDVTATVESIPLITASILSKKLAAGLDGLVIDVKFGSGAFAGDAAEAEELARSIVEVANGAGLSTSALLSDMNQVLGLSAGNAVEVRESIEFLSGGVRESRLHEVTLALAAELLTLGGLAANAEAARAMAQKSLDTGAAAERFAAMVTALGGPANLFERPEQVVLAEHEMPVMPDHPGHIVAIDVRRIGLAIIALGGGRRRAGDAIDHGVGLNRMAGLGDEVGSERPLCLIHARSSTAAEEAAAAVRAAVTLGEMAVPGPLVLKRIGP